MYLDRVPEFERFDHTDNEYERVERTYKDDMILRVQVIAASDDGNEAAGRRIFRALIPNEGPLLRWQTDDDFARKFPALAPAFYTAIGRLARDEGSTVDAIMAAAETFAQLRAQGATTLTMGEIVSVAFSVAGMARPDQAVPFKIFKAQALGKLLTGDPIFTGSVLQRDQVERWLDLLRRIETVMRDEWHWHPRDLIDVQGFAWVALDEKWKVEDEMDDDAVLARFQGSDLFRALAAKWTSVQTSAFCAMARAAHDVGLDWYFTNMPQEPVRLGRKPERERRAKATIGYLNDRTVPRLWMSDRPERPQIGQHDFALTAAHAEAFAQALREHSDAIEGWEAPPSPRLGRWPDEAGLDGRLEPTEGQIEMDATVPDPTNLILYGPPGTGKTYVTAARAVRLCGEDVPADRTELMAAYKRLSEAGRIEFVTFHQSMAYEEFVEGLRPSSVDEDGQPLAAGFRLAPTPGIFRKIARRAELSTGANSETFTVGDRQVFKMSIGDATKAEWAWLFDHAIAEGYAYLGFGNIDWSDDRYADRAAVLEAVKAHTGERGFFTEGTEPSLQAGPVKSPDLFRNEVKIGDVIIVSKGLSLFRAIGVVEGDYEYAPREDGRYSHRRKVRWLWRDADGVPISEINAKRLSIDTIYRLSRDNLNIPALERYANSQQETGSGAPEPFVLVIDEINRANISKVFGELITLLEADKRIGADNELHVRLPYSGDSFGVPANLHIVGTMNTADRSIALLDTALRRRFTFEELMPDPEELASVDGVDLPALLRTLNDRIEYLFDREHQIGHAYFLPRGKCDTRKAINDVMRYKVIPLLAEYFYEDWTKVAAVLGDVFDDDGKRHEGGFFVREPLTSPFAGSSEEEGARYRWTVKSLGDFSYDKAIVHQAKSA